MKVIFVVGFNCGDLAVVVKELSFARIELKTDIGVKVHHIGHGSVRTVGKFLNIRARDDTGGIVGINDLEEAVNVFDRNDVNDIL